MTRVFQRLRDFYAQSLRAWTRFSGDGDVLYFADLRTHPIARDALSSFEKSFEKISDLEQRVIRRETDCTKAAKMASSTDYFHQRTIANDDLDEAPHYTGQPSDKPGKLHGEL